MLDACVAVIKFILAVALADISQFRLVLAQLRNLLRVVFVNNLFDRHGAGHRPARTQQRGCGPQGKSGDMPQGLQRCWPDSSLRDQLVEFCQMFTLLDGHAANYPARWTAAKHAELAFIDAHGPVFTGLVYANDAVDQFLTGQVAGQATISLRRLFAQRAFLPTDRAQMTVATPITMENKAL